MSAEQAGPAKMAGTTTDERERQQAELPPEIIYALIADILTGKNRQKSSSSPSAKFLTTILKGVVYSSMLAGLLTILYSSWSLILLLKPIPLLVGGWSLMFLSALIVKTLGK